ncbi:MAG: hypothetical protein LUO93_04695 [Methanomicrobiales archaeon]|nr:hypothetical protein [Methanomicrobiales archaeon]
MNRRYGRRCSAGTSRRHYLRLSGVRLAGTATGSIASQEGVACQRSQTAHIDTEKIDATLDAERARLVALLRRLADRLEAAPLSHITEGLAWVTGGVEVLMRAVERALGRDQHA